MQWEEYRKTTGIFNGHNYEIAFPINKNESGQYIWRTEFFGAFPSVDVGMLELGYTIVYYNVSDMYGCAEAIHKMEAFQDFIEKEYSLHHNPILFGFSRGGLYALHYAAKNPKKIKGLYLDAPVVDIYSWPGGKFNGDGAEKEWLECIQLWKNISHDDFMNIVNNSINILIRNRIPLAMVVGGVDTAVPFDENGIILKEAYEKTDIPFLFIYKPDCGHHPHSLSEPKEIVDFLENLK